MNPDLMDFVWASKGRVFHKRPKLAGYVCGSCGYVEFWKEG